MAAGWDRVYVIGIDDGAPTTVAPAERELIDAADLLCGGARHLKLFPDGKAERIRIGDSLAELYALLADAPGQRRAVVLASGDPCFYGIGPLLAERLGRERVFIHPHPSSIAMAFARLGIAWQDAAVLSVHGRPIDAAIPAAFCATKLALLTDPDHTPAAVARALLDAGMEDCDAFVCERLGGPEEQIHARRLQSLPQCRFDPLNVLILLRERDSVVRPALGRPDAHFKSLRGQITKAEVRVVAISRLDPWRTELAWDIGSGSGSVAIELAGLMQRGRVFAIERDVAQLTVLRSNIAHHRATRVSVVPEAAPEALAGLPPPDAVFIGGSGDKLGEILSRVVDRLRPGGRLVANFTRLESLATWQRAVAELGWEHDLIQITVARSSPIGDGTRLAAQGPVFVTQLQRPEAGS